MIIDGLLELLPRPDSPSESGKGRDWRRVTARFGKPLPGDYMAFIDNYGSGEVGGWLSVLNPFSSNPYLSLVDQFFGLLSSISSLKEEFPETCPYPLMFEPGGLMPWGISMDGDIYCWATAGVSGRWSVVVIGRHSEPEQFELSMCEFIEQSIKGEIRPAAIPEDWPDGPVAFEPYRL